jgi:hypothetical protein
MNTGIHITPSKAMASRIKLTFLDSNPAGANDNDGFKIYRGIGADPCPNVDANGDTVANPATLIYTSVPADITAGTGSVDWEDPDVVGATSYHYRASFTRGAEESFSTEVGPVSVASINDLGYPNGTPSHTSGVPNFVTTEPIVHFDAGAELLSHGPGYVYANGEHFINKPATYSTPGTGFGDVGAMSSAVYSKSIIAYTGTDTARNPVSVVGELPSNTPNWNSPNFTGTNGYMDSEGCYAFAMDEGVTSFHVVAPSLTGTGAGNAYKLGATHTDGHGAHYYYTTGGSNPWANGNAATAPRSSDFGVHYWSSRLNVNLDDHFDSSGTALGQYGTGWAPYPNLGLTIGYGATAKDNSWFIEAGLATPELRLSSPPVQNDLSIVVSIIKPDGRQRAWVNGAKLMDRPVMQNVGFNVGKQPLPMLTPKVGWGLYQGTKAEQLYFPKSLDSAEFQMVISYLEAKYDTWTHTQQAYSGVFA